MQYEQAEAPIDVLLVEDSSDDVLMAREALEGNPYIRRLHVAGDGADALTMLRGGAGRGAAVRPGLILLDLNMPKKSGFQVLEELKQDPELSAIPVIVMSTARSHDDILACYRLHANCFVTKPFDFEDFNRRINGIVQFWRTVATLPDCKEE